MRRALLPLLLACGVLAVGPAAAAAKLTSVYTSLDLKACRIVKRFTEGGGAAWVCEGFAGIPVRVAEGDLRTFVSFGPKAEEQRAARQTLQPFNTVHTALEWRIEERDGQQRPIATILRYFWESDSKKGETLVVTRLGQNDACHMAYVRADGNPQANEMARAAADARADGFDCAKDEPERIGGAAFVGSIPR